jgi:hypothetical protein
LKSFEGNLSVNYIVQQDDKGGERISALMEYSIDICSLFGRFGFLIKQACALVLYPHIKKDFEIGMV